MHPSSPQAREMADESMVRNLSAQAEAIWPQEQAIFAGHGMPSTILDVGCGMGLLGHILARRAGMDYLDPRLARRARELMATEVMPRVNARIAKETIAA